MVLTDRICCLVKLHSQSTATDGPSEHGWKDLGLYFRKTLVSLTGIPMGSLCQDMQRYRYVINIRSISRIKRLDAKKSGAG